MSIHFKPAKTFTTTAAHLQYFARLLVLIQLKSLDEKAEDEEYFLAQMTNLVAKSPINSDQTTFSTLKVK
ncbi:hypothetical protein HDV05_002861, partial [Chytridiales sp. JEL 0842]